MADAEDFVDDAIDKSMARVRIWNRANCTLFQHLAGVIVSDISHTAQSSHSNFILFDHARPNGSTTWPPDMPDQAPDQEHLTVWLSEQRRLLEHLRAIDPTMGRMAEFMLVQDMCETRDLCQALEVTSSEVANLRKRLKRAVRAYLTEDRP